MCTVIVSNNATRRITTHPAVCRRALRDDLFIDYYTGAILLTLSSAWLLLSPLRKPKTEPLKERV